MDLTRTHTGIHPRDTKHLSGGLALVVRRLLSEQQEVWRQLDKQLQWLRGLHENYADYKYAPTLVERRKQQIQKLQLKLDNLNDQMQELNINHYPKMRKKGLMLNLVRKSKIW